MQGNIWNCRRLVRWPILQDYIEMELQKTPCGSFLTSLCQETTHKIQSRCSLKTTALPVCAKYHQIWQRQPSPLSPWRKSLSKQSTKEMHPKNGRQFPILCASSGSYYINGTVGNRLATSGANWEYNGTCQSFSWLHVDTSRCNYLVLCLWHDSQCSFWCIVLLCTKSLQPCWWLFLPSQYPTGWKPN